MNSRNTFFNYANAELKVDETFTTDKRITIKQKKTYAEAVTYDNTLTSTNAANLSNIYCELLWKM